MPSLKKLAIRGAVWTVAGYGTSQALRLGSNLVLTRLLAPDLFGLMSLVNIFLMGLNLFSDLGVGPSIIQNKRGDEPDFLNSAWTLQVIRGFLLWLGCLAIAWPISHYYDPRLLWLLPVAGLASIISGFDSTALFTLNRKLALDKIIRFDFVVQVLSLSVMLIWAWLDPTIWALVAGSLAGALFKMVGSHRLIPNYANRLAWKPEAIRELFSFGRWIFMSTAMTFLAEQSDRLILGKLISLRLLGIYNVAFTFAYLPEQVIDRVSGLVIFPLISQQVGLPRNELRTKILQKRRLVLAAAALLLAVFISFGDTIILTLYDPRYQQAAWMLPILALGVWPRLLATTMAQALLAVGKPLYVACGNSLKFCYMLVGLPLGYSLLGLAGAIVVVAFNDLPLYGAVSYGLWREKLTAFGQDFQATMVFIGLVALILLGRYYWGFGIPLAELF